MVQQPLSIIANEPHLSVTSFPFRDGHGATATAIVNCPLDELWDALLDLESFPEHIPMIDHAVSRSTDRDDVIYCALSGKIGVWKLGISLDIRYKMRMEPKSRLELIEYEGGVFKDVYFLHEVEPVDATNTRLTSTFYFNTEGFPLLKLLKVFERFPWMAEMLNLTATATLVRGHQLRWE